MKDYEKNLTRNITIGGALIVCIIFFLSSCTESNPARLTGTDDGPPKQVTEIKVENLHGGAEISYKLPEDRNLLYVKAVWSTNTNAHRETKATYFKNSLRVDGFITTSPREVKLYSYSRGGSSSEAKTVTVNPLTPPVTNVFESIRIAPAFGGVSLSYQNPDTADVTITVLAKDSTDRFAPLQREYTSAKEGVFYIRGLNDEPREFGYYVRDEFENRSDTLFTTLTPLFEEKLDKNKFSNARLPTDNWEARFGALDSRVWDDKTPFGPNTYFQSLFQPFPFWVTIDLGQKVKIGRIALYGWPGTSNFSGKAAKVYEFWGSAAPNVKDEVPFDDSWWKYGSFESTTPSGEDPPTQEDINSTYADGGDQTTIPDASSFPVTRYLRIKFEASWSGINNIMLAEIDVYGQPVDDATQ